MEPHTADVAVPPSWEEAEPSQARAPQHSCTPRPQRPAPSPLGCGDCHPHPSTGCSHPHHGHSNGPISSTGTCHHLSDTSIAAHLPSTHPPQPLPPHRYCALCSSLTWGSPNAIPQCPTVRPQRHPTCSLSQNGGTASPHPDEFYIPLPPQLPPQLQALLQAKHPPHSPWCFPLLVSLGPGMGLDTKQRPWLKHGRTPCCLEQNLSQNPVRSLGEPERDHDRGIGTRASPEPLSTDRGDGRFPRQ